MSDFNSINGNFYFPKKTKEAVDLSSFNSAFSFDDIEGLEYGFKFDLVSNMDDPLNRNNPRCPVVYFVSKSDKRPNIYLFYKPKTNSFSLKYKGKITKNLFKTIAQGFVLNTLDELKDFLSKSNMLKDSYWDFIDAL